MIDIIMLGSGGGIPIPERYLSSMIINFKGRKILIDAGEGTQVAMREFHTGFRSLDIICLTHFHGDHIFGLPGLLSTLSNSNRVKPITIIGPSGLKRVIDGLLVSLQFLNFPIELIENPSQDLHFKIEDDILKLTQEKDQYDDIIISSLELQHSTNCLGYSFYVPRLPKFNPEKAVKLNIPKELWSTLKIGEEVEFEGEKYDSKNFLGQVRRGIKISFITDTRPIPEIIPFIEESDLFICEGTYGDDKKSEKAIDNSHMTFREAATLAKEARVEKLLLTHFSAGLEDTDKYKENAREVFPNTVIAYDGITENINFKD